MSFVTRPILCGGVGCGFEMSSQLPLALDSSARMNTAKAGCLAQWLGDTVGPTEATTDSTSKVVDDSHAEDCKTWLFISGGTSGSDVPPLFFGKGGAVNITKTKEYALAQAHAAALLYHERLEGRSIKIHCEDDLTLAIVWESGNFAHLCGLDYYLDDSKRCRLPPRKLYEDLLRGRRISPKRVSPHGDVQWLKKKADVLTDAMDMSKVTHVVVPGNSRIVLYAGNEVWCIGLGRMRDGRYYPQPLVKKSFDEVRKTGTVTHIVAAVETMGL